MSIYKDVSLFWKLTKDLPINKTLDRLTNTIDVMGFVPSNESLRDLYVVFDCKRVWQKAMIDSAVRNIQRQRNSLNSKTDTKGDTA